MWTSTCGCLSRRDATASESQVWATTGPTPNLSSARCNPCSELISFFSSSNVFEIVRARSSKIFPAAVGKAPCRVRSNNVYRIHTLKFLNPRVNVGWEIPSSFAARAKLRCLSRKGHT